MTESPDARRLCHTLCYIYLLMLCSVSLRGAFATKQSRRFDTKQQDCFAALAMTATLAFLA